MVGILPFPEIKKSCPISLKCWDRNYYPAVPPGLMLSHPLNAYQHMLTLFTKCLLRLPYSPFGFLFALESPFDPVFFIAIPPPATLLKEVTILTTLSHRFEDFISHSKICCQQFFILSSICVSHRDAL